MRILILSIFLNISVAFSQGNSEIFVYDISEKNDVSVLENGKNISNNEGYDNQPFFYTNNKITFAATRNQFTDIVLYNLKNGKKRHISDTKNGGEYSPQRIPNSKDISAVRLDADGLQRFYKYAFKSGKPTEIIPDLKVAYPTWIDKNRVIAVTIVNDSLELFVCDLKNKTNISVAKNVGRSVHKIPNTNLVSFISKEDENNWVIKSLNPKTLEIKTIIKTGKKEDFCWLPNGIILLSKENTILKFNPKTATNWQVFHVFSKEKHTNITRISANKKGTLLALATE